MLPFLQLTAGNGLHYSMCPFKESIIRTVFVYISVGVFELGLPVLRQPFYSNLSQGSGEGLRVAPRFVAISVVVR
jgi:hypothetical protein